MKTYKAHELIGNTPLVEISRIHSGPNRIFAKLEGQNPGGSIKDRPAWQMVVGALESGRAAAGDTLIEATSGNTGIGLAFAAAVHGLKMRLVMPEHMSRERIAAMKSFGAEVVLTPREKSMEGAIDLARSMEKGGEGLILDQFNNPANPQAHYLGTGPEIWRDTAGEITHFVASTGTTGTLMGVSDFLKEQNPGIHVAAVRPDRDGGIPGIRAWPEDYLPQIFRAANIDENIEMSRYLAEETARKLVSGEGISAGISSGGNVAAAVQLARRLEDAGTRNACIVTIICDRADRYLSTGVFG